MAKKSVIYTLSDKLSRAEAFANLVNFDPIRESLSLYSRNNVFFYSKVCARKK